MRSVRLFVLALVLFLPWVSALPVVAQDASPVAATWADPALDLAAMPVTPGQMTALGHPGYGRFHNGYYFPTDWFLEGVTDFYGPALDEVHTALDPLGIVRAYGSDMGLPVTPGDAETYPEHGAYMNVIEFTNLDEADAFLTFIGQAATDPDATFTAILSPFTMGDGAVITNYSSPDPDGGQTYSDLSLVFRTGNLYVVTGLWSQLPTETATPVATPAADATVSSPAGTVADLEAIGRQALANIDAVRAGSPNLPNLLLRLGDDPLEATYDYSEGYRLLNGEVLPYYADRDDDLIADPAMLTGATAAYELEEKFQPGDEPGPNDFYFLNRLFTFPDEATAMTFMASRPDALASGGFAKVADAAPGAGETLLPGEGTDLGDESLTFSFVRAFADDSQYVGHEVYVRVGNTVAAMSLEGPPTTSLQVVTDIAAVQAACLEAGACPGVIPVPEVILVAAMATPVSGTPVP